MYISTHLILRNRLLQGRGFQLIVLRSDDSSIAARRVDEIWGNFQAPQGLPDHKGLKGQQELKDHRDRQELKGFRD
ncbi:hypothetical protein D3C71_1833040 [compost metagenome]